MEDKEESLDYEFANSTTCHGVARIANAKNKTHGAMWSLIFFGAFGLCTWQIVDRVQNYFEYRTGTEINVNLEQQLTFPAVTICNFNRIRASGVTLNDVLYLGAAFHIPDLVDDPEALNAYIAGVDWDAFNASAELLQDYAGYTRRNGFVLDNSTVVECKWKGRPCYAENFTHVFTSYGNCWTFNGDKNAPLQQTTPGAGHGLKLTLDIQTNEYTEDPLTGNLEYGLMFQVHDQNEPPRVELDGTAVAPGSHAYASTFQTKYKNLQTPWGQCDPAKGQGYLQYYDSYSLSGCLLECRANTVASCGCRPMYYPGNLDYCTPLNLSSCVLPTLATFLRENNELQACGCTVPCEYTSYSSQVSYAGFPSPKGAQFFTTTYNFSDGYLNTNIVLLDVYYRELMSTTYEQFKAVEESGLISDVGGQLGFFIGCSVITLWEFFEYLVLKFVAFTCQSKVDFSDKNGGTETFAKVRVPESKQRPFQETTELSAIPSVHTT